MMAMILLLLVSCEKEIPPNSPEDFSGTWESVARDNSYWKLSITATPTVDAVMYVDGDIVINHSVFSSELIDDTLYYRSNYMTGFGVMTHFGKCVLIDKNTMYVFMPYIITEDNTNLTKLKFIKR